MTDKHKEQHWDREMAEVDRLLKRLPTYDAGSGSGGTPTVRRSGGQARPVEAGSATGAWIRVVLGLALAAGMTIWPYSHVCGLKLFAYIGGIVTLIVAGGWSAVSTWRHRLGAAHVLALAVLVWGVVLATGVILPRIGAARGDALWLCPEPMPTASR